MPYFSRAWYLSSAFGSVTRRPPRISSIAAFSCSFVTPNERSSLPVDPESAIRPRSEEHTSELQSPCNLVCRLLLEKKKTTIPPCPLSRGKTEPAPISLAPGRTGGFRQLHTSGRPLVDLDDIRSSI